MKFTNFEVLSILKGLDLIIESKKELLECDCLTTKDIYFDDISRIENLKEKVKDFEIDSPFFITYRELFDFQSESAEEESAEEESAEEESAEEESAEEESAEEIEEKPKEDPFESNVLTIVEDKELSNSKVSQGYAFLTYTGECLCEYIYYFDDLSLEVYDLSESKTEYYSNLFMYEIKDILEEKFYWGVF